MSEKELKMRDLRVEDIETLTKILRTALKDFSFLQNLITSGKAELNLPAPSIAPINSDHIYQAVHSATISNIIDVCLGACQTMMIEWFANLYEMNVEDFRMADPDIIFDTIDDLSTRESSRRFFSRAFAIFKKTPLLGNIVEALKTSFSSATA